MNHLKTYFYFLSITLTQASEIHEWGTFTTVSGSDGKLLSGLHVEEELLPPFVYSHAGVTYHKSRYPQYIREQLARGMSTTGIFKGMPNNHELRNVTVKMETPVLYFYGDQKESYNIKINFNGGTISQWYPQRKSGDTLPTLPAGLYLSGADNDKKSVIDFKDSFEGHIEWDVDTIPRDQADEALTFKPNQSLTWEYPRVPDANMLKVGEEYENFLFYRGIGNFKQAATFSVDHKETVNIKNHSTEAIPFAFAFEHTDTFIRYKTFPSGIKTSASIPESDWTVCDPANWQSEVFQQMRNGLLAQGLTLDESNGMVKTWWNSYFQHQGLRVFWVLPQSELETVLPIQITPKPEKILRVMIGRSDILRPTFEQQLKSDLENGKIANWAHDRFYEPYVNRLKAIVPNPYHAKLSKSILLTQNFIQLYHQADGTNIPNRNKSMKFVERDGNIITSSDKRICNIIDNKTLLIGDQKYVYNPTENTLKSPSIDTEGNYYVMQMPLLLGDK